MGKRLFPIPCWHPVPMVTKIVLGLVALVVLLGGVGAIAYAADAPVEATIIEKDCPGALRGGPGEVTVKTKLFGIEHSLDVPRDQCLAVQEGNFARYHVRSQRTELYDKEGGRCIFDSEKGIGC